MKCGILPPKNVFHSLYHTGITMNKTTSLDTTCREIIYFSKKGYIPAPSLTSIAHFSFSLFIRLYPQRGRHSCGHNTAECLKGKNILVNDIK